MPTFDPLKTYRQKKEPTTNTTILPKVIMQGKLIAFANTLSTY